MEDLRAYDIEFRRLLRQVVGPPANVDWTAPWHDILHVWNSRVQDFVEQAGIRTWSAQCVYQYWSFAAYTQQLPETRLIKRILNWKPHGKVRVGRPRLTWIYKLEAYSRMTHMPWQTWNADFYDEHVEHFIDFCCSSIP